MAAISVKTTSTSILKEPSPNLCKKNVTESKATTFTASTNILRCIPSTTKSSSLISLNNERPSSLEIKTGVTSHSINNLYDITASDGNKNLAASTLVLPTLSLRDKMDGSELISPPTISTTNSNSALLSPSRISSSFLPDIPKWKRDLIQRRKQNMARTLNSTVTVNYSNNSGGDGQSNERMLLKANTSININKADSNNRNTWTFSPISSSTLSAPSTYLSLMSGNNMNVEQYSAAATSVFTDALNIPECKPSDY